MVFTASILTNGCSEKQDKIFTNTELIAIVNSPEFSSYSEWGENLTGQSNSDLIIFKKIKESIIYNKFYGVFPEPKIISFGAREIGLDIVRGQSRLVVLKKGELLPHSFLVIEKIVEGRIYSVERTLNRKR